MDFVLGLLGKFALPLCAILVVAFLAFIGYHALTVKMLRSDIEAKATQISKLVQDNATLKLQAATLTEALNTQNAKILALVNASINRAKMADEAIASAKAQATRWKSKYDNLINQPPPTKDECESLGVTITQYFDLRHAEAAQPQ